MADEAEHDESSDAQDDVDRGVRSQIGPADDARSADRTLRAVRVTLLRELDTSIDSLERARLDNAAREHLEVLRSLLKAQVDAYLGHFLSGDAVHLPDTSAAHADEAGAEGVVTTTLRRLIERGTLTSRQAAKLAQFVGERRTLIVFGSRGTGKSTLLNALFELVSVDERFVAIVRGPDLPALEDRSFCVRLTVDEDTDIAALFAKARRMQPGRLVVGEIHREDVRHLFALLTETPSAAGMATLRAETVHKAVGTLVKAVGDGDPAMGRATLAAARPVFAHMHADETGRPRLAALWSVGGLEGDQLAVEAVRTSAVIAPTLVPDG